MARVVLVTGGAGYVGSHACKALARAGYTPISVDNLSRGNRWAVKWGPLINANIGDPAALDRVILTHQPEAVLHFAAFAYVGESVREPALYYRNNVIGTLTLLECMRRHHVDKIVFSSSCATYGLPRKLPIPERHPQLPINPYGRTKLAIESALRDFAQAYGLKSVSLRYFNAAGADEDGEIGELHKPETHVIPLALEAAAGVVSGFTINGREHETPDGTCIRDYIHVDDLARAHVLALEALEGGHGAHAYNLGTGSGFSVQQVVDTVKKVTGKDFKVDYGPARRGDPPVLVADATLARNRLQWRPKFNDLEPIVRSAWRWTRRRLEHPQSYS